MTKISPRMDGLAALITSGQDSQLMWGPKYHSWRLVFAFLPPSRSTPPTFFNVTWKQNQDGKWRTMNTPKWQDFFKDLRMRKPDTEMMRIQLHGTDLAHLPFAGKLKWLIEFLPQWQWFLTWAPGKAPSISRRPVLGLRPQAC